MYSLRQASTGSTRLGLALGRLGGRRSVSATSNAAAPVPGDQGVGMDPAKQQHPPSSHAAEGKQQDNNHHGDVMTDSFGEAYWTRSEEEGFGGIYGQNDPEYDTSEGSDVKGKEKARHLDDDKHAAN